MGMSKIYCRTFPLDPDLESRLQRNEHDARIDRIKASDFRCVEEHASIMLVVKTFHDFSTSTNAISCPELRLTRFLVQIIGGVSIPVVYL